ncbi:MAG: septum formation initiator family protein [Candidatus Cloacimonadaceae bacterium]|nr:septum formation initiator family protein [Candidatus Cloacimonadaceae bacterium]MDP3113848.1 septum formation initiator family protein [Candidatus Cloacimonadaceae bacterium]
MRPQQQKPARIFRLLYYAAMIFLLSWILLWGQNSFLRTWNNGRKMSVLEAEVNTLKAVNDSLAAENNRLRTSPAAAEKVAREKFGLIKEGEKVFRFLPAPDTDPNTVKKDKQ